VPGRAAVAAGGASGVPKASAVGVSSPENSRKNRRIVGGLHGSRAGHPGRNRGPGSSVAGARGSVRGLSEGSAGGRDSTAGRGGNAGQLIVWVGTGSGRDA
jgi:hypothetical protein